ncbi:transcription factor GTE1-like isoform X2 [Beta vulgaris subsp. vulgaris]|uniref:transcription factor GTE1-like isoform X2 n=1 Tax=Beta vulgaris subsp. vulgaris TaxID=3555 RepID=UPI0020371153|nr:transcription factor GTE1-like isoform X2 [Beta vulgaris subsp. vulgaris]
MEPLPDFKEPANVERVQNDDELESFKRCMNEASHQLEQQIQEIEQFYSSNCKNKLIDVKNNSVRIKDKGRPATRSQNQQDGKAASKRMDDLVNQFDTILNKDKIREEERGLKQAYHAQMAKEVSNKLYKVDVYLKELRKVVLRRCRRMSTPEKKELGRALTKLSAKDLKKALEIVAEGNPNFQAIAEEVDLDLDAQSESTLWRLKYFVFEILQVQGRDEDRGKQSASTGGDKNDEKKDDTAANTSKHWKSNCKRKRGSLDAL